MQQPVLNLYTSNPADAGFRSLATLLAQEQPVQLRDLSELPAPDTIRRQRLRTERAALAQKLTADRDLVRLARAHVRLAPEVADIKYDMSRYEQRIAEIDQQLAQEGGPADG
ncbi:hypothetical protein CDA63_11880 [Hymenobacter amundsenii]|uniref:Uncharacterized protein n=1 Tax=Hymenobacter amundsenii TaxID=2006685 RepID=A0A246FK43_9BACT|nr:hypothetical protein [Hymenobacter amundsenii]OWP62911.1 hypothetical protein CDA63_11880 [Hymenobacter amundsenii]